MFAALTVVRLREAVAKAGLLDKKSWVSPEEDDVDAVDLPLARAVEKVLGSMHAVLTRTKKARDEELKGLKEHLDDEDAGSAESEKRAGLRRAKAAEVRVTRCMAELRDPVAEWTAVPWVAGLENGGDTPLG